MPRRLLGLVCLLVVLAAPTATLPATAGAAGTGQDASLETGVLEQLNQIRVAHHLVPLTLSTALDEAAAQHSRDMITKGYFGHNSPNGAPFWKRIEGFYPAKAYGYWSVGENLFWSSGSVHASVGMAAWMASPEHRANILDPAWRQIGIAALSTRDAPGTFRGLGVTVITTDFGVRRA